MHHLASPSAFRNIPENSRLRTSPFCHQAGDEGPESLKGCGMLQGFTVDGAAFGNGGSALLPGNVAIWLLLLYDLGLVCLGQVFA